MASEFPVRAKGPPRGEEYLEFPAELAGLPRSELTTLYIRVYWALKRLRAHFVPQVNYEGGAGYPGGTRVDFLLPDRNMVIYVQGPYYHETGESRARDMLNELMLRARGITPVLIWFWELENTEMAEAAVLRKIGYSLGADRQKREWQGA